MKLTAKLAKSQLLTNRSRTMWALLGVILSTAMITAVYGFVASGFELVDGLLSDESSLHDLYRATVAGIGTVLSGMVTVASIIVISNSFRVSASERMAQFGMLKSVGATKKQIASSIMYEGVFLNTIGVPFGIFFGLFVNFSGVTIINHFLYELNESATANLHVEFVFAFWVLIVAAVLAFTTTLLSAWLPARKASRVSAIDAIRGAGEVKVKDKSVRGGSIIKLFFGFEGYLAAKSIRRSKRNFRATLISLSLSVTLLIAASGFFLQMTRFSDLFWPGIDATSFVGLVMNGERLEDGSWREFTFPTSQVNEFTERLRAQSDGRVFGFGSYQGQYSVDIPTEMLGPRMSELINPNNVNPNNTFMPNILVVDPYHHAQLAHLAGVSADSNILLNHGQSRDDDGRRFEVTPLIFSGQTLTLRRRGGGERELTLHGQLTRENLPNELLDMAVNLSVIVPYTPNLHRFSWYIDSENPSVIFDYSRELFEEVEYDFHSWRVDIRHEQAIMRTMTNLVMTLSFGFIAFLTLIGLTNVISTISTNVRHRSGEFAVLQSAGMTRRGIIKMLRLESLICSIKSLFFGLPLGVLASYLIYRAIGVSADFDFSVPWLPMLLSTFGVCVISWVIMRFAASRLKGQSIVEAIEKK